MREIPLAPVNTSAAPALTTLRDHLAVLPLPARTLDLLGDSAGPIGGPLHALVDHLAGDDVDPICFDREVRRLVGLGPGLTPTGDDLLVALAATSRRSIAVPAPAGQGSSRAAALASAIAAIPRGLTTDVAHHLLTASVAGRFPEPLADLVNALGDPGADGATVAALARRLAAIGAHSGADWLAGVVALARALSVQEPGTRRQESGVGRPTCPVA